MAKNYMQDVAKMLGVKLEEEFMVTEDDSIYKLTKDGLEYKSDDGNRYYANNVFLNLLDGTIEIVKLPWQPKSGDEYYYPACNFKDVFSTNWTYSVVDFAYKEAGLIFKTYEECEAALPALRKKYLGGDDNV
jgi:hypothetical protein|nr:MAG TPA: hypothetical protein [Caudoviricetes sp.]